MIKLGVAQAAGDREGQHGSQPHVAVRVHGRTSSSSAPSARRSRSRSRSCCSTRPSPKRSARSPSELRAELKKTQERRRRGAQGGARRRSRRRAAVRFEGNNYSEEWVKDAAKRGLLNLRRTPEALAQLATKQAQDAARRARHPSRRRSSSRATTCARALRQGHADRDAHAARDGRHDRAAGGVRVLGITRSRRPPRRRSRASRVVPQVDAANERRQADQGASEAAGSAGQGHREGGGDARLARSLRGVSDARKARTRWPPCAARPTRSKAWWTTIAGRCRSTGRCCSLSELTRVTTSSVSTSHNVVASPDARCVTHADTGIVTVRDQYLTR